MISSGITLTIIVEEDASSCGTFKSLVEDSRLARLKRPEDVLPRHLLAADDVEKLKAKDIGFAHVLGSLLNGLFVDNLDRDIELVNRMNDVILTMSRWKKRNYPWRYVETLHMRPSTSISKVAQADYHVLPKLLKVMLNLLGTQSGELLSFLLFEPTFTKELIQLGYDDTMQAADMINEFFKA